MTDDTQARLTEAYNTIDRALSGDHHSKTALTHLMTTIDRLTQRLGQLQEAYALLSADKDEHLNARNRLMKDLGKARKELKEVKENHHLTPLRFGRAQSHMIFTSSPGPLPSAIVYEGVLYEVHSIDAEGVYYLTQEPRAILPTEEEL